MPQNILLILNEATFMEPTADGFKFNAPCGKHGTLAQIVALIRFGYNVCIYDQSRYSLSDSLEKGTFPVVRLNMENFGDVVAAYHEENNNLKERVKSEIRKQLTSNGSYKYDQDLTLTNYQTTRAKDYVAESNFKLEEISCDQIEGINARVDPMLSSFTEKDKAKAKENEQSAFKWSMDNYKQTFPNFVFNCPNNPNIGDKVSTFLVDNYLIESGKETIAIPTKEFSITHDADNNRFVEAINYIISKREKIFPDHSVKIVFKPRDSAQSYGVFGFEIVKQGQFGLNLESLKNIPMEILMSDDLQLLQIQPDLSDAEMKEITDIMLYVQSAKVEKPNPLKELNEISKEEILALAQKLYDTEIQVQPFLEGIINGDIRANIIKNGAGKWISAGHTFRAKIAAKEGEPIKGVVCDKDGNVIGKQFTSCYSAGKATSARVEFILSPEEANSLDEKVKSLLSTLNGPLKELYNDCRELGVDLIPVGDGEIMLGEINHTDPALMPLSEMLYQSIVEFVEELKGKEDLNAQEAKFIENFGDIASRPPYPEFKYDGGLGGAKLYCLAHI